MIIHGFTRLQLYLLTETAYSPTSVYCEQAFSIATSFITKLRLSDQSIDDLQFEKGYFANESYYK